MCAMLIGVPAGNPLTFTANVAVAEVTFPEPSFTTLSVMLAVPLPVDSTPVTGGVSSDGLSVAANVCVLFPEGVLGELSLLLHAATAARDTTSARALTYFIVQLL